MTTTTDLTIGTRVIRAFDRKPGTVVAFRPATEHYPHDSWVVQFDDEPAGEVWSGWRDAWVIAYDDDPTPYYVQREGYGRVTVALTREECGWYIAGAEANGGSGYSIHRVTDH